MVNFIFLDHQQVKIIMFCCLPGVSSFGSHLVKSGFSHIGSFFGLVEFVLKLSEFAQVGVGLFFSFFGLSFVGLDFDLQFVDQVLDSAQVLLVLFGLVRNFFDFPFHLSVGFDGFGSSFLFGVKFVFEFSHSSFEFLDLFSATFKSNLFGFIESNLEFFDGGFHVLLHSFKMLALVLFFLELFRHHGGISNRFLGLLFGVSAFRDGFFNFTLSLLKFSFEFSFLVDESGVLGVEKVGSFVGLVEFGFSEFSASFSLFDGVSEFFDFTSEEVGSSFDNSHLFTNVFVSSFSFVVFGEVVLDGALEHLSLFGGFVGLSVGMAKLDFQVVEVAFELLLLSNGFGSRFGFRIQTGLHGFKSSLTVSSGVIDFF